MTKQDFLNLLKNGPLILDGATGSNLMKAGLPRGVCTEKWITEHPQILLDLQKDYVSAGSKIIYAPTFSANPISLSKHGLSDQTEYLNKTLVALSKEAADGKAFVAGDITTVGELMEPFGDMEYEPLFEAYAEQITHLVEAGVDLLVAETMMTISETVVALEASASVCNLPVLCTLTVQADGSLFFGGDIFEAVKTLQEKGAAAVGCNCSVGPEQLIPIIAEIRKIATVPVIAKPNAGMPSVSSTGETIYEMSKEDFAGSMKKLVDAGADIVGGCCGTTPEFIRELCNILR